MVQLSVADEVFILRIYKLTINPHTLIGEVAIMHPGPQSDYY